MKKFIVLLFVITSFFSFVPQNVKIKAAWGEPVRGKHAMVASQHKLASEIGSDVMKKGGNAVDAAIAVALALAVVYP
ncbi:MAG: gamma-glutamyltransferase, partial [Pyrinomonadaceae bacterium]